METHSFNSAVDTRRWARTDPARIREALRDIAIKPSREDEQRYGKTAPPPKVDDREPTDERKNS